MSSSLIRKESGAEWLEFISRLGFFDLDQARAIFLSGDYTQLPDLGQKALYTAGRGKTLSLEGNLIGSKLTFDEALLLAEDLNAMNGFPVKDELLAYVHYERAGFFVKFGETYHGLNHYRAARRLVETENLKSTIDFQIYSMDVEAGRTDSDHEIHTWASYFEQRDMTIMHLVALRRIARFYSVHQEYSTAVSWIQKATEQSVKYDLPFMVEQYRNVEGYLNYMRGDHARAMLIYQDLLPAVTLRYLKSTILENMTLIHYAAEDYESAADTLNQAIEQSQKYNALSQVPDQCLFMGEMQRDKFHQPELATQYFEIGYLAALKMAEHGFPLRGDRLKVVQAFENRARVGYSIPDQLESVKPPFQFAIGWEWKEILDEFHFTLLTSHLEAENGGSDLTRHLDLKASTYYAIKRRLSQNGYQFESGEGPSRQKMSSADKNRFQIYVSGLMELSWKAANLKFEAEIIEFLFKHVGYQKTRLAEELNLSYPTVLQKTKTLTAGGD